MIDTSMILNITALAITAISAIMTWLSYREGGKLRRQNGLILAALVHTGSVIQARIDGGEIVGLTLGAVGTAAGTSSAKGRSDVEGGHEPTSG